MSAQVLTPGSSSACPTPRRHWPHCLQLEKKMGLKSHPSYRAAKNCSTGLCWRYYLNNDQFYLSQHGGKHPQLSHHFWWLESDYLSWMPTWRHRSSDWLDQGLVWLWEIELAVGRSHLKETKTSLSWHLDRNTSYWRLNQTYVHLLWALKRLVPMLMLCSDRSSLQAVNFISASLYTT